MSDLVHELVAIRNIGYDEIYANFLEDLKSCIRKYPHLNDYYLETVHHREVDKEIIKRLNEQNIHSQRHNGRIHVIIPLNI